MKRANPVTLSHTPMMLSQGKLIEYLDNGKFICALVTSVQPKRVHLINQNSREVSLPAARIIHCSKENHNTTASRNDLVQLLKETTTKRTSLMDHISLEEVWELVVEETTNNFDPVFLAELCFGEIADDNATAAFMRCILSDRRFFKYKEGKIKVFSKEQVEQLITRGAETIRHIMDNGLNGDPLDRWQEACLKLLRDYYLFSNDAENDDIAKKMLKKAQLTQPHAPFDLLVKAGVWSKNENIPLLKSDLAVSFSLAARQQAEMILQTKHEELFADPGRTDYTHLKPMTIDGPTTLDFDDALSVEKTDQGYLVGIHISDVAHYVTPGTPLFEEAIHRGTSVYFPEGQIPMLPRHLSQGICSLIQDEIRAAFSFMILLSEEAEVLQVRIKPSIIKVARRLTYEEADTLIETDEELRILNMLRNKLRKKRLDNGALLLPFPDVNIFVDSQGKIHVSLGKTNTPARSLVSEMMILANTEAARFVSDRMVPGLFRAQPPIKQRLVHGEDDDLFLNVRQRKQLPRGELLTVANPHSGLGVQQYTTITSPIRRLLDLIMQHQLNAISRRQEPTFSESMCQDFSSVISRTVTTANNVKQQRHRYWLLKYLEEKQGQLVDALVIDSGPKRIFLLLKEVLMDVDLAAPSGTRPTPGETVKVRISRVAPLDNTLRLEWP